MFTRTRILIASAAAAAIAAQGSGVFRVCELCRVCMSLSGSACCDRLGPRFELGNLPETLNCKFAAWHR
jgi:hypothetical protein